MVPLDLPSVTTHTAPMPLLTILGVVSILLAILGLAGVLATTVGVEIALFIVGIVLVLLDRGDRLRL